MISNLHFKQAPQVSFMQNKPFENYWSQICLGTHARDVVQFNSFIVRASSLAKAAKDNNILR